MWSKITWKSGGRTSDPRYWAVRPPNARAQLEEHGVLRYKIVELNKNPFGPTNKSFSGLNKELAHQKSIHSPSLVKGNPSPVLGIVSSAGPALCQGRWSIFTPVRQVCRLILAAMHFRWWEELKKLKPRVSVLLNFCLWDGAVLAAYQMSPIVHV